MEYFEQRGGRRAWKYNLDSNDKHIPNKAEGKLLRKLMAQTGMAEEEIRSEKKYRKMLAEESKKGESDNNHKNSREERKLMKIVTKKLGLAKEHPKSIAMFNELLEERKGSWGWGWKYRYIQKK